MSGSAGRAAELASIILLAGAIALTPAMAVYAQGAATGSAPVASATQAAPGTAATPSRTELKALIAHLQRHYQDTASFKANFKETIARTGAPPRERTGVIYYRKPGRLRWEFAQPQPETIVSDGALIYDYDPGLNQVVETPLKSALKSPSAASFMLGVGNVARDFTALALAAPPGDPLAHIALIPRGGGDKIELGLDRSNFDIVTLALTDALGNRTVLEFSAVERNVPVASSLFEFTVPAGADIVNSQGSPH
jgi:outer membrane lipoprotein carrier protein